MLFQPLRLLFVHLALCFFKVVGQNWNLHVRLYEACQQLSIPAPQLCCSPLAVVSLPEASRSLSVSSSTHEDFISKPLFSLFNFFIGMQLIYSVVLFSAAQHRESAITVHISTLFEILSPHSSFQSTDSSSLCYTYSRSLLVIYFTRSSARTSIPVSQYIPPPPHGSRKFPLSKAVSVLLISSSVLFF